MAVVQIETLPEHTGYAPAAMNLNLAPAQARKLCRIRCGLIAEGATLAGAGGVITSNVEAIKYLIEQAATP